jgi:t-SNARE complex subunit (syntaxin)
MGRLNTDVHKIHEVFSDLAGLVSQQSEAVDSIEKDVEAAHDRTGKGVGQIEKAASHQKGGFKCVIIALSIVAGVLAVVALAAVVYTKYASPI